MTYQSEQFITEAAETEEFRKTARLARSVGPWEEFASYAEELALGRRKLALAHLHAFTREMHRAGPEEQVRFTQWFLSHVDSRPHAGTLGKAPLVTSVLASGVRRLLQAFPEDALYCRWMAFYVCGTMEMLTQDADIWSREAYLERAIRLDPEDRCSRIELIRRPIESLINGLQFAVHELPAGYLGENPHADLDESAAARVRLRDMPDPKLADELRGNLDRLETIISLWLIHNADLPDTVWDERRAAWKAILVRHGIA